MTAKEFVESHGKDIVAAIERLVTGKFVEEDEGIKRAYQEFDNETRRTFQVYGICIGVMPIPDYLPLAVSGIKAAIVGAFDHYLDEVKKEGDVIVWRRHPEVDYADNVVKNAYETISRVKVTMRCTAVPRDVWRKYRRLVD